MKKGVSQLQKKNESHAVKFLEGFDFSFNEMGEGKLRPGGYLRCAL